MLHKLNNEDVKAFVTAGKAVFTIDSGVTGTRYTYRVTKAPDGNCWFVGVMLGTDNENSYSYICYFRRDMVVRTSSKSRLASDSKPVVAFEFFMNHLDNIPRNLNVYHSCKCGRCGRTLTTPESIVRGLGPECARYA